MKANSLNTLAWQKLKQNKLALSSLGFIVMCVLLGVLTVVVSPDGSPMANEMHIELATHQPFTKVIFLETPKESVKEVSFMEGLFFGKPLLVTRTPIEKFTAQHNGLAISLALSLAINEQKKLSNEEMLALKTELLKCNIPSVCPLGKATLINLQTADLEKYF